MKISSRLIVSLILVITFIFAPISTFAHEKDMSDGYAETHYQFDMEELGLSIANKNDLIVTATRSANPIKNWLAEKEKIKLEKYLEKYPEVRNDLITTINDNEDIVAFGYTEAPMQYDEQEKTFMRIKENFSLQNLMLSLTAKAADKTTTSEGTPKYYFTLSTKVIRRGVTDPYTYQTISKGVWSKNGVDDEKYPSNDGFDYIVQSCPSSLTRTFDSVSLIYSDDDYVPVNGFDYSRCDGDNNFVAYSVQDKPSSFKWLKSVDLLINSRGNYSSRTRKIHSYYIHAWEETDISISPSVSVNLDDIVSFEVGISVTDTTKYWKVYNYVNFAF